MYNMKHVLFLLLFSSIALLTKADPSHPIWTAIVFDEADTILSLLEEDPSILEMRDQAERTPLLKSVLVGKINAFKTLLELGADATATFEYGYNALHAAAANGRTEILEMLINHYENAPEGKKLNLFFDKHEDGFYPLHRACEGGYPRHADCVSLMLRYGVAYDLKSEDGKTCEELTINEDVKKVIQEAREKANRAALPNEIGSDEL